MKKIKGDYMMNRKKIHWLIDWGVILIFLLLIWCSWIDHDLWGKITYIAPVIVFLALGILFLNHVSLIQCFKSRDKEFFLMCGGILLGGLNMILVKSGIGAIFTLADLLLILYLANKVQFDFIQLGSVALSCLAIWFFWQFIDHSTYDAGDVVFNTNGLSMVIFSCFCVLVCYMIYLIISFFSIPQWTCYLLVLPFVYFLTVRVFSFNARGILAAIFTWAVTYYILPKKKFTIALVLGVSLLLPAAYVYLWKSGATDGVMILGKRLASGRDRIWDQFFNVFIQHPITGIGSDFEHMIPDVYIKEIHHALLDLLFVHGVPVFCVVLYFLYQRTKDIITAHSGHITAVCLAAIYGMFAAGTFENYYIVTPYNILLFMVFLISHAFVQQKAAASSSDL